MYEQLVCTQCFWEGFWVAEGSAGKGTIPFELCAMCIHYLLNNKHNLKFRNTRIKELK